MNYPHQLVEAFAQTFSQGDSFKTINHARQLAQAILGENIASGTPLAKLVDESIERGLVRAAHQLVSAGGTPLQVYERLVDLYQRQPILGTRSSTSVAQQAYSTPLPIAYLASQLAKIRPDSTVYEPTAGNGSLLLSSEPNKVFANELNQDRANDLREQGYTVTQFDATNYMPSHEVDVVIANPPFGTIRTEGGKAKVFEIVGANKDYSFVSTQIDHVIALNSLKVMREDGKAVLILGGKMGDERSRSISYNSQTTRAFYYSLYNQYNVTRHISINGDLYARQGAGFPIDVILIEGRGTSKLALPAAEVPRIYRSFDELKELLPNELVYEYQQSLDTSLSRTNERRFGSSIDPTQPKPDTELQRVSGAASDESRVDDPARGTVRGLADGEPLHKERRNVLRSIELVREGRSSQQVGSSLDRGESVFSGEAELRPGDQLPSDSDREHGSFGDYRTNTIVGMATADGSRAKRRLDVEMRSTQYKSSTNLQSGETMAAGEQTDDNLSPVTEQPRQVPYIPLSKAQPSNTLAPANMQSGMANALAQLQKETGSLDEYVASRLNYGSLPQLHQYLNAEQVDAVALAINNLEKRRGFILGDQTGVGKGRVVASVIRYAKETGRIPIFVTQDTKLYADMIRDLGDINMVGFRPFVTNAGLNIPLPDGRRLKTSTTMHKPEMQTLRQSGSIGDYDAIFTTYSQMQSVKGQETDRRSFLRTMAPKSIIILDESHEAGGTKDNKLTTVPDRAEFARELLSLSQGAVYSSATFAKRPDVMDLYALTDMGRAVSTEKLVGLVERGGIPMQQGLATMLVAAGQYIRRERSYEGVSFDAKISPVDKDVAENMSSIMGAILDFDRIKQKTVKQLDKELKAEAKSLALDTSIGGAGVDKLIGIQVA